MGAQAKACVFAAFLVLVAAGGAEAIGVARSSQGSAVTPVEKVIQLLKRLSAQIEEQGKEEASQYDKYACFCKEQADNKQYAIEKSNAIVIKLTAKIEDLDGDIVELNGQILELSGEITRYEERVFALMRVRRSEHETYLIQEQNVSTAIYAAAMAIQALKESKGQLVDAKLGDGASMGGSSNAYAAPNGAERGPKWEWKTMGTEGSESAPWAGHDGGDAPWLTWGNGTQTNTTQNATPPVPPNTSLLELTRSILQVSSGVASEKEMRILSDIASNGLGSPPRYSYRSNDIIAVLQKLYVKFKQSKQEFDETEFGLQRDFETEVQSIANQRGFAVEAKTQKEELVAAKTEEREAAAQDKAAEQDARDSDQNFMGVLKADCEAKAENWDQRSKTRSEELAAIAKALEYLEGTVSDTWKANKKLVDLQRGRAHVISGRSASFLQLRNDPHKKVSGSKSPALDAFQLLQKAAGHLQSPALSVVAFKVKLSTDHFVKVRTIIKDLIARLESDALAEQTTKGFCDEHMAAAVSSRDQATAQIEQKAAGISRKEAERQTLRREIADLSREIADLRKELLEETELRSTESADNSRTVAMSEDGAEAVRFALSVLRDFYSAFLQSAYKPPNSDRDSQTVGDLAPEVWEGTYHGRKDSAKGIIGLLEVILSDFERTKATVEQQEAQAKSDFDRMVSETNTAIQEKSGLEETKKGLVTDATDAITTLTSDKIEAVNSKNASLMELQKLHPMCVQGEETWEERRLKREKEIEALKQAHAILEDWQQ